MAGNVMPGSILAQPAWDVHAADRAPGHGESERRRQARSFRYEPIAGGERGRHTTLLRWTRQDGTAGCNSLTIRQLPFRAACGERSDQLRDAGCASLAGTVGACVRRVADAVPQARRHDWRCNGQTINLVPARNAGPATDRPSFFASASARLLPAVISRRNNGQRSFNENPFGGSVARQRLPAANNRQPRYGANSPTERATTIRSGAQGRRSF